MEASTSLVWALLGMVGFVVLSTAATALLLWRKSRRAIPTLGEVLVPAREPWNTFPISPASFAAHRHHSSGPRI